MSVIRVSIVVPCYNQAKFLSETLDSILTQTCVDWECIIVDDGSSDDTESIARLYFEKDCRFKYLWQENSGVSEARNNGIKKSSGIYILPLDADDLIAPEYVEKAADYLDNHFDCKLVYCKANRFGAECGYWDLPEYSFEELIWRNSIFCTAMYRRCDYDNTGGYNVNMKHGNEDWDFWLSLLTKQDKVHRLDEILFYYRIKQSSRTLSLLKNRDLKEKSIRQIYNNHPSLYSSEIENIILWHNKAQDYFYKNDKLFSELTSIKSSIIFKMYRLLSLPQRLFNRMNKK